MSASGGAKVSRKPAPITGSPRFVSSPLAGAVLGGPVFLLTGGYVLLLSFGLVPGGAVDPWVVVPLGLLFFLAGLYLVVAGIRGTRRARRVRDADRPWTEDRAWTPDRLPDEALRSVRTFLGIATGFLLLVLPWHVAAVTGEGPAGMWAALLPFDLVVVGFLAWTAFVVARWRKYADVRVSVRECPTFVGDPVRVRIDGGPLLHSADAFRLRLRCVEEAWVTRRKESDIRLRRLYEATQDVPADGGGRAEVELPIPADLPGNNLVCAGMDEPPVHYWELEVRADATGIDYRGAFILPVYARP